MGQSPHTARDLATARDTLTNLALLERLTPDQRRQVVESAQAILHADRLSRQVPATPAAQAAPATVISLALWKAGRRRMRTRRAPIIVLPRSHTPVDAA